MKDLIHVEKDKYLIHEGDPATSLFMIKNGTFAVIHARGYLEKRITHIHAGEIIGELSLFDGRRHDVSLKAVMDSEVVEIPYSGVHKQLEQLPEWAQAFMKSLIDHMQKIVKHARVKAGHFVEESVQRNELNKYLSILNFISLQHSRFTNEILSNYAVQIFDEPIVRMNVILDRLIPLGYFSQEKNAQGEFEIIPHRTQELLDFVEWYRAWLLLPPDQQKIALTESEVRVAEAILHFVDKSKVDAQGLVKARLQPVYSHSILELGYAVTAEDVNALVLNKKLPRPLLEESDLSMIIDLHSLSLSVLRSKIYNALAGVLV